MFGDVKFDDRYLGKYVNDTGMMSSISTQGLKLLQCLLILNNKLRNIMQF